MPSELNFDANQVAPNSAPAPVPAGEYRAHITDSEVKPTSSGQGKYLELTHEILDGEYKGRKIWARLNIVNPNAQAQQIAQGQLSAICHATGVLQLKNSAQLHGIPMLVRVTVRQDSGYEPQNEIKGWKPCGQVTPLPTAAAAAPAAPSANAPAWAQPRSA